MTTNSALSPRLRAVVDALPLRPGMRVLEIGGAPGAAARAVAERLGPDGHILVIDRSARGIELTARHARREIESGVMSVRCTAVEDFTLEPDEAPYDVAFACRVGALDGRHPRQGLIAQERIKAALVPGGLLHIDGGTPLRTLEL